MSILTPKSLGSDFWFKIALIIIAAGLILKSQYDIKNLSMEIENQQTKLNRISNEINALKTIEPITNHVEDTLITEAKPVLTEWETNKEIVIEIQRRLRALGLYHGDIDGIHGRKTTRGLIRFQRSKGLVSTGELTEETYSLLVQK